MSINERIEELLKFHSLNVNQLANRLNVAPTVIANIIKGRKSKPSYTLLSKILESFDNISAEWLMRGVGSFVNFMYHCFIRRTELSKLKVGDVELLNRTIRVNSGDSKNRKQDSVSIPDGFLPILNEMGLSRYPEDMYVFGHGLIPGPNYYKNPDLITDMHRVFLKKLNIKYPKTLYSWKHTGVCDYYNVTKDPYVIMRQLRHSDLSITMIYLKSMGLAPNMVMQNAFIEL